MQKGTSGDLSLCGGLGRSVSLVTPQKFGSAVRT